MELSQVKVRGLPGLKQTGWLIIHPHISLIQAGDTEQANNFLAALEAINPIRDIRQNNALRNYIPFTKINGYTKRVDPAKKTAAYGIFTADPQLIMKLGRINTVYYETDRIEVGRRLDCSRWISFVELPGSSKLAEFEHMAAPIFDTFSELQKEEYQHLVDKWLFTDRISGKLAEQLRNWWKSNTQDVSDKELAAKCLKIIELEHETNQARALVEEKMPYTILIEPNSPLASVYSLSRREKDLNDSAVLFLSLLQDHIFNSSGKALDTLASGIASYTAKLDQNLDLPEIDFSEEQLLISVKKNSFSCINRMLLFLLLAKASHLPAPVFLIDLDQTNTSSGDIRRLLDQLATLSAECQLIIYSSNTQEAFSNTNHRPVPLPSLTS